MNTKEALGFLKQLIELRRFVASQPALRQTHRRISPEELASQRPRSSPPARPDPLRP
ncbi:MAG: hypothetical protein JF632_02575 [Acidobacteria bacterium]|nr:hypothetical protein [Acidobacteriota bacterium]